MNSRPLLSLLLIAGLAACYATDVDEPSGDTEPAAAADALWSTTASCIPVPDVRASVVFEPVAQETGELNYDGIGAVGRFSSGEFVVAGRATPQLVWFDSTGAVLGRAGGAGDGPGEFGSIDRLWVLPGDTLSVMEIRAGSDSRLTADGSFVHRTSLPDALQGRGVSVQHRFTDGGFLVTETPVQLPAAGDRYLRADTARIRILHQDGSRSDGLGDFLRQPFYFDQSRAQQGVFLYAPVPYAARSGMVVVGDSLLLVSHGGPEVRLLDREGRFRGALPLPTSATSVNPDAVAAYFADRFGDDAVALEMADWFADALAAVPVPNSTPAHHGPGMAWDAARQWLWIQEREVAHADFDTLRQLAVDGEGEIRARVEVPGAISIIEVFRDGLLVEDRRAFDEEIIRWVPFSGC